MGAQDPQIGDRIAEGMKNKGIETQSKLAELMHVSRMTVSQWITNTSQPRPENLAALAVLLFDGDFLYLVHGPAREPEGGFRTLPPRPLTPDSGGSGTFKSPFKRSAKT